MSALTHPQLLRLTLRRPEEGPGTTPRRNRLSQFPVPTQRAAQMRLPETRLRARKNKAGDAKVAEKASVAKVAAVEEAEEGEEVEEESWIAEKVEDVRDITHALVAAVPGPRVGSSGAPWLLALPVAYLGLTFVIAVVKTVRKSFSPRVKRQRQVNKNAGLMESLDELLLPEEGVPTVTFSPSAFQAQERKFGFGAEEVLRKYVRYALNEKPFGPQLVGALIRLRKASGLTDEQVAEILNDIARRTVKAKGPVVMDTSGFTEKGLQRKAAVQALFSKLLYLSELEDFCAETVRDKLQLKPIFGVTDEDADSIRIVSLSSTEDLDKLDIAMNGSRSDDDNEEEGKDSA